MEGSGARQRLEVDLGSETYLEYVPELLIPLAGSRYQQDIRVTLGYGSLRSSVSSPSPRGVSPRGEAFAYERLRLSLTIQVGGRDVCVDTARSRAVTAIADLAWAARPVPVLRLHCRRQSGLPDRTCSCPRPGNHRTRERVVLRLGIFRRVLAPYARVLAFSPGELRRTLAAGWEAARLMLTGHPAPGRRK